VTTTGSLHFPTNTQVPEPLVTRLIEVRLNQLQ
jgi:hypothetical protein